MKRALAAFALAGACMAISAGQADAQDYRFDFGIGGGGAYWTDMLGEDQLGADAEGVAFKPGWLVGGQATYWPRSRWGIRANLGYTERPLEDVAAPTVGGFGGGFDDINLWSASGDLLIRLREPATRWEGSEILPYVALGVGAKFINPAGEQFTTGTGGDEKEGAVFSAGGENWLLAEEKQLMGLAGLGADWRLTPRFALRLEAGDRFFDAPIYALDGSSGTLVLADGDEDVGKLTHEIYGQIGLHWLAGLQEPERVVIAVPPAPAPPPAPEPEPEGRPVRVCVIDPGEVSGFRTVEATYYPVEGDTLAFQNGQEVAIDRVAGNAEVASESDWYIAGRPLVVAVDGGQTEYVAYMGPRRIESYQLAYLGTVDGLPVYANASETATFDAELRRARQADPNAELEDFLEDDPAVRNAFNDIEVLYVPLERTGCVFQAVQRVEEVRKATG